MRRLLPLALLALGLAACGGGGPTVPASGLGDRILHAHDLGPGFSAFYDNRQTQLDTQGTPRADQSRFGREGGWIVRFKRAGSARGPLLVESRIDVFGGAGGAKRDLDLYRRMYDTAPGAQHRALTVPKVGADTLGDTFVQAGGQPVRFFRIAWRYRNATAQVVVEGFNGMVSTDDALRLARKQQQRLARGG